MRLCCQTRAFGLLLQDILVFRERRDESAAALSSQPGNGEPVNCFQNINGTYKSAFTGQFQLNLMFQGFNLLPEGGQQGT